MKRTIKIIGYVLTAASIAFLVYRCYSLGLDVREIRITSSAVIFSIVSLLIDSLSVLLLAACYRRTVILCSRDMISSKEADRIYCRSNIGKYLPGNVFQYVERNLFLNGHGITQTDAAACSCVEIIGLLAAGMILSLLMNGMQIFDIMKDRIDTIYIIVILTAVIAVIIVSAVLIIRSERFKSSFTLYSRPGLKKCLAVNLCYYFLVLLLMGLAFSLIICSFEDMGYSAYNIFRTSGAFIFSWMLGFVVIGAPGGIGIREAALASLLGSGLKIETVISAVVLGRLISVAADLLVWGVSEIAYKNKSDQ